MPANAIYVSAAVVLAGVLLNYVLPEKVFTYVTSVATFAAIWTWAVIIIAQMNFRKTFTKGQVEKLKYPMVAFPEANYIALAFLALVMVIMWFDNDTRVALIVGPIWLAILTGLYYGTGIHNASTLKLTNDSELENVG